MRRGLATVPDTNEKKENPKKEKKIHAKAASFAEGRFDDKPAVLRGVTAFTL